MLGGEKYARGEPIQVRYSLVHEAIGLHPVLGVARENLGGTPEADRELEHGVVTRVVSETPAMVWSVVVAARIDGKAHERIEHGIQEVIVHAIRGMARCEKGGKLEIRADGLLAEVVGWRKKHLWWRVCAG